jgi:PII-like signaling protein
MPTAKPAKLLRLHFAESDYHAGKPLYLAVVDRCKELGVAGATVFRGLEGYGETAALHRRRLLHADQPIVVTVVDTAENIARLISEIELMLDTAVIAVSDVEAIRLEAPRPAA